MTVLAIPAGRATRAAPQAPAGLGQSASIAIATEFRDGEWYFAEWIDPHGIRQLGAGKSRGRALMRLQRHITTWWPDTVVRTNDRMAA